MLGRADSFEWELPPNAVGCWNNDHREKRNEQHRSQGKDPKPIGSLIGDGHGRNVILGWQVAALGAKVPVVEVIALGAVPRSHNEIMSDGTNPR